MNGFGDFSKFFGRIEPGKCRLTMNGGIAVQTGPSTYKTYNVEKGTLTNVSNFCFDPGMDIFFVMPTNKVKEGDIVLIDNSPKCVIKADKKVITVMDYKTSEIKQIVPERHIFMGNTVFFGKIVSILGNKAGKGMGGMLKMMMMSQLFGGNKTDNGGGMFGNMGQMMAMQMMMGNDDSFTNMFDGLGFDAIGDTDAEDDNDPDSEL